MPQKPVTSIEVAQLAGVSQPTVSRAFDPQGNIAPATRARVLEAARQLGYQPNAIARSLSTQRSDIIGVVMGNFTSSLFYPTLLEAFTRRLQALGKQLLLFYNNPNQPVDEVLPFIMSYQVDGVVIASTTPGREIIDECTSMGTPVVLLNRTVPDSGANSVCSDNEEGGRIVAQALVDAGHRKLAFMAGVGITATNTLRRQGFVEQLRELGHGDPIESLGDYSYDSGYATALHILDRDDPPDGIFCAADIIAIGAMDAARYKLGIRIPDELSIIGYDDIPVASWPAYDLTTIRQPATQMVATAIDLLQPQQDGIITGNNVLLPGELVWRSSARMPLDL